MRAKDAMRRMVTGSGMSSRRASVLIGRGPSYLSNMLGADPSPSIMTLIVLAEALGYDVLLEGNGRPSVRLTGVDGVGVADATKYLLRHHGMSARGLSGRIGRGPCFVTNMVNGGHMPRVSSFAAIASVLGYELVVTDGVERIEITED